jgi:hypothetical protein
MSKRSTVDIDKKHENDHKLALKLINQLKLYDKEAAKEVEKKYEEDEQ